MESFDTEYFKQKVSNVESGAVSDGIGTKKSMASC